MLDKFSMVESATKSTFDLSDKSGTERPGGVPAFKEWAIVCASIERGETSVIFRKGGIAEGRNGFEFKHRRFFLFPTFFHEQIERTRLGRDRDLAPRLDPVTISVFVEVEFAAIVRDLSLVQSLEAFHVLQPSVLKERFHYDDQDGLYVAFLRAFRVSPVWELPFRPAFGGCRSWITLPNAPAGLKMEPVLEDQEQTRRRTICADGLGVDQREKSLFKNS